MGEVVTRSPFGNEWRNDILKDKDRELKAAKRLKRVKNKEVF